MERTIYGHRAVRQIVMVEGWHALYWNEQHYIYPIQALGLGHTIEHDARTGQPLNPGHNTPEEEWEIFGLEYSLTDHWNICQDASNFCGLAPPGTTCTEWEEHGHCENRHRDIRAKEA